MRKQLAIRYSKIDVLESAWDQVLASVMLKASRRKDQPVLKLVQDIAVLQNRPVRRQLLRLYLNKCRELHSIAFLQWRLLYPAETVVVENVEELILARMSNLVNGLDFDQRPSSETQKAAKVPSVMLDKYQNVEVGGAKGQYMRLFAANKERTIHKINSFFDIGWADPFTEEEFAGLDLGNAIKLPKGTGDLVYDRSRYCAEYSPYVIYLPTGAVMFKLMRACLSCKDESQLWFNGQYRNEEDEKDKINE